MVEVRHMVPMGRRAEVNRPGARCVVMPGHHEHRATPPLGSARRPQGRLSRCLGASSVLADAPASPVFDLDFYGTREEGTTREEQDIEDGVAFQKHGGFHTGRPDWEQVFCQAISKAHSSNPDEGEPVGVFFCGSPAVARELRRTAQKVTTEHQHASGNCKCRLIVHKENF